MSDRATVYEDLTDLQKQALEAYPDKDVVWAISEGTPVEECGDGLVRFIIAEASDAGDSAQELTDMLDRAVRELETVRDAIAQLV